MSGQIGAFTLHKIAKELDETQDKTLLPQLYEELSKVVDEIEQKLFSNDASSKENLSKDKRDELFTKLKEVISTKRAKKIAPILEEFDKYNLSQNDKELFNKIKELVNSYKYKDALELLS